MTMSAGAFELQLAASATSIGNDRSITQDANSIPGTPAKQ
jgi:hypothetical protein